MNNCTCGHGSVDPKALPAAHADYCECREPVVLVIEGHDKPFKTIKIEVEPTRTDSYEVIAAVREFVDMLKARF